MGGVGVDPKPVRVVREFIADGSEVRSLAGRSAKLGDGIPRNPPDRDEVLAQRTKDLAGLMGQAQAVDLDAYLPEYDQHRYALPWTLPLDSVPERSSAAASAVSADALGGFLLSVASQAGVSRKVKVPYPPH